MEISNLVVTKRNEGYNIVFYNCDKKENIKIIANEDDIEFDEGDSFKNLTTVISFIVDNKDKWFVTKVLEV